MTFSLPYQFQYSDPIPAAINTYQGLRAGVLQWMARPGDTLLDSRFDDFLRNCERRIYYGYATDDFANPLRSDPLRIVEMETVDPLFSLTAADPSDIQGVRITDTDDVRVTDDFVPQSFVTGEVPVPTDFLELISATLNGPPYPLQIVAQRTIDGYCQNNDGCPRMIAVSGLNFRVFPAPGTGSTVTLRYYQSLATPTSDGTVTNAILTNYADLYLYGCLIEAALFTQDAEAAQRYLGLFNSSATGLNQRTLAITRSANPVMRLRGVRVV